MNEKFQNALNRVPQKVPPIWMMRQAGRYHSHYQGMRRDHSFKDLCMQPELAAEVALGPVKEFDFDVSILFSDILFPLEALGMPLEYNPGPQLGFNFNEKTEFKPVDEAIPFMEFQAAALKCTREVLPKDKSLIGFVGGVWTLFVYAVQGTHKNGCIKAKKALPLWTKFCETMVPFIEENIDLQLKAGAEVVMIFDTAAGELSPSMYYQTVRPVLERLAQRFPEKLGYYGKGITGEHVQAYQDLPWAGLGYDHRFFLPERLKYQEKGFIQGNFDQELLHVSTSQFHYLLNQYLHPLRDMDTTGWVCGLGHGVLPETPELHVKSFVQVVREVLSK